jgi:hypothetical protein
MQKQEPLTIPQLADVTSWDSMKAWTKAIYQFLKDFLRVDKDFKDRLVAEITPLYGDFSYTPASIANGGQSSFTISVANAMPGYTVIGSYGDSLQGVNATYTISAPGVVTVNLANNTGGSVTLNASKFRVYVQPRVLV